jgi:hypothetical protein
MLLIRTSALKGTTTVVHIEFDEQSIRIIWAGRASPTGKQFMIDEHDDDLRGVLWAGRPGHAIARSTILLNSSRPPTTTGDDPGCVTRSLSQVARASVPSTSILW